MKFDLIVKATERAAVRHKKKVDMHIDKVVKALDWIYKNGHDGVDCGLVVKFKRKRCMITTYNLNYPWCYFNLQPMSSNDDIGNGKGSSFSIEF